MKGAGTYIRLVLILAVWVVIATGCGTGYAWSFTTEPTFWAKNFYGGINPDEAKSVDQTSDGGYVVTGSTQSQGAGNKDVWVLKLNQDGSADWQKTYGGGNEDYAESIQQTADGGYILAGRTQSFGAGGIDAWVLKLNSDGSVNWQKAYGGGSSDFAYSVQQTSDGGYIVGARTNSFGAGNYDAWVLKLNSDGTVNWENAYGGGGSDGAMAVLQTADGGYIVGGGTYSFGVGAGDMWALKLDAAGAVTWQKSYGDAGDEFAYSIYQTADGGYLMTGYTTSYGAGNFDFWVFKLDSSGTVQQQKVYGSTDFDTPHSIIEDSDGKYVVTGQVGFGAGSRDVWLLRLNTDMTIALQKTYGGGSAENGNSVQQTPDGGYIVAGYTQSYGGGLSFWVLKLDSSGDIGAACALIGTSSATVTSTAISGAATAGATNASSATITSTSVVGSATAATEGTQCTVP